MPDRIDSQVHADFSAVRRRAFLRRVWALLTGQKGNRQLLNYDEVREKLRVGGPVHRGLQAVRIDQIVGSVDRYGDFDREFLPTQDHTAARWRRVNRAWYEDISLPPILLYQVGEIYFVVDGNHRVSVAREQGQEYIDAEVRECQVRVPVTPDLKAEDLEILGAKVEFLERSSLDRLRPDAQMETTVLGGYDRLLEHIAVHHYFMGLNWQRDISEAEAVTHWYDSVYLPVVNVIRESELMDMFKGKTETDFYLWVMDHQHYLVSHGQAELLEPEQAAEALVEHLQNPTSGA